MSFFIALLALLSIIVTWTKNVFMSLMYSVMLFINATIVLLMLGFEFLALVNVLVYVGALAVLFLFVIMLLEVPTTELRAYYRGFSVLALLGVFGSRLFFGYGPSTNFGAESTYIPRTSCAYGVVEFSFGKFNHVAGTNNMSTPFVSFNPTLESISTIGYAFYIRYADVLILNSLVLTIALFGALVLAHTRAS